MLIFIKLVVIFALIVFLCRKVSKSINERGARRWAAHRGAVADANVIIRSLRNGWEGHGRRWTAAAAKEARAKLFKIVSAHGLTPRECEINSWEAVNEMVAAVEVAEAERQRAKATGTDSGLELDTSGNYRRKQALREVRDAIVQLRDAHQEALDMTGATASQLRGKINRLRYEFGLTLQECGLMNWETATRYSDAVILRENVERMRVVRIESRRRTARAS